MLAQNVDLETVDPRGRVDVLAFKGAEKLVKAFEEKHGLSGIWDNLKPHINNVVSQNLTGMEIPTELKVLLGILQANYKPKGVE